MTFRLGLTGSIGMGKSTTAQMFAEEGCAVWDADAAVHRLYARGGAAVEAMEAAFPGIVRDGAVYRPALRERVAGDPDALRVIEGIVHPLVRQDREAFASEATEQILVFDIPLLFETGSQNAFDAVACVSVSPQLQRDRVMERGTMTEAQFETIRAKQMDNSKKCARSDFVIDTTTLEGARKAVQTVIEQINDRMRDA